MKTHLRPILPHRLRSLARAPRAARVDHAPNTPPTADPVTSGQCWLCLYFSHLPLEVYAGAGGPTQHPLVIVSEAGPRAEVVDLNRAARTHGLYIGMSVTAASAVVPDLQICEGDHLAEAAALRGLAAWAYQFTSWVSLASSAVLLEVGGSERLFAGRALLIRRIDQGVRALGFRPRLAFAPNAQAATMLARAQGASVEDATQLASALSTLRLANLDLPPATLQACAQLGLRTVGELLRLPRDGLSRRFGTVLLDYFDRARGRIVDPRAQFALPAEFNATLPFPADVRQTDALLFGVQRLLKMLQGFLRAHDAGAQTLNLRLLHAAPPHTDIALHLLAPQRAPQHLLTVMRERIERTALRAPVTALELRAGDLQPWTARAEDLFAHKKNADSHLFERLQARLGSARLQGLTTAETHSPECAWHYRALSERAQSSARDISSPRPLWLLPVPQSLAVSAGTPQWYGTLTLRQGPERIESGWWQQDRTRDYFIAETSDGAQLWIFRERRSRAWFLHGFFA